MSTRYAQGGPAQGETVPVRRTWEGPPPRVQSPLYGAPRPHREPPPPLEQQVLRWRVQGEMAHAIAGWLKVAFLVLLLAAMAPFVIHIWHTYGPLTGGHP